MTQAASRALDLLTAVVCSTEPKGLMDLADATGIDKSTASRLLGLLTRRGLLVRCDTSKRYQAGPEFVAMVASFSSRLDIRVLCAPHLTSLRDASGETASLHLRVGQRRVCIDGAESEQAVRRVIPLGESLPLYQGPSGKVILAQLTDLELGRILGVACHEGVNVAALREQLAGIRSQGFASTVGDRTPGVRAVSACISGQLGPVGSITVAGPAERWHADAASRLTPQVVEAARRVSTDLGGAAA